MKSITDPLLGLNDAQRDAVVCTEGPVLVLAGAGSGKTRVLAHRIAYIVTQGLTKPWQVLAVTFTNKAARELKHRVISIAPDGDEVAAGTFHSMLLRLLRREAKATGYPSDFSVFDNDDSVRLVKLILKEQSEDRFLPRSVHSTISRLKSDLVKPEQYAEVVNNPREEVVAKVYVEYERRLKRLAGMDFDDLLIRPIELFENHPTVLAKWNQRWKYLHVDEYQDTNLAQFELIRILGGPSPNLCVVGDDDQSIYGWRGARVENIFRFRGTFRDAKVFRLEQNYRSTQAILDLAHAVVSQSSRREEKRLWTDRTGGKIPVVKGLPSDLDEAREVVDRIGRSVLAGKRQFKDFAILYRTNAQSRLFEDELRSNRYPYQVVGSVGFYNRKEVRDALAYSKICLNPRDDISLGRIISEPPRGIGAVTLKRLVSWANDRDLPLTEAMKSAGDIGEISPRSAKACRKFAEQIESWRSSIKDGPLEKWAMHLLEDSGYIERLEGDGGFDAQTRLENLEALIDSLAEFSAQGGSLAEYLEESALATDVDRYDPDADSVRLMTLHAAKGLEFPVVFVTGLEQGLFPLKDEDEYILDLDEERRLFYVGVTRARDELYLTHAMQRRRWGKVEFCDPSCFINELPEDRVQWDSAISTHRSLFVNKTARLHEASESSTVQGRSNSTPSGYSVWKEKASSGSKPALKREQPVMNPEDIPAVRPGDLVEHPKFGQGIVISTAPWRNDLKVSVEFSQAGVHHLLQSIARLQPVKDFH